MKLKDLKSVLYSSKGNMQSAILWDINSQKDLENGATIDYIVSHYGNYEAEHIEAFENNILITVRKEVKIMKTRYLTNKFIVSFEDIKHCTNMKEIEDYIFTTAIIDTEPTEITEEQMSGHSHFNGVYFGNCKTQLLEFEMYWKEEDGDIYPQEFDVNLFEKVLVKPYNSNIELFWNNEHFSEDMDGIYSTYCNKEFFGNADEAIKEWRLDFYQDLKEIFKYIDLFNEDIINECVDTVEIYIGASISDNF